jgi:hypothetical protein
MGNIYREQSIDAPYQVLVHWPSQAILVSDLSIFQIFSSQTAWQNEPKLGRKHLWTVRYKILKGNLRN